ncbi:hypothetical protein DEO72_LG3g1170 [Vigna unguiculata]|uniref:Uncharacterized protein n=1 Tax=Vigna unguiculata TaxID=3917 RepID=A0A4D6LE03_VIGUN|nr:hypothetical protein DEO72_LG3g1170 [Vigna unguiculata]
MGVCVAKLCSSLACRVVRVSYLCAILMKSRPPNELARFRSTIVYFCCRFCHSPSELGPTVIARPVRRSRLATATYVIPMSSLLT